MKLNKKGLLIISVLLFPIMVFAKSMNSGESFISFLGAIGFMSIHSSLAVLSPLSKIISQDNHKKAFWILFIVRIAVLLILYSIIGFGTIAIDFISVFVGAIVITPLSSSVLQKRRSELAKLGQSVPTNKVNVNLKCAKCGASITVTDNVCPYCGSKIEGDNIMVTEAKPKVKVLPTAFDKIYSLTEDKMVEEFIKREMVKAGLNQNEKLIPLDIFKRKKILNIIFSILLFVLISMIFFHFPHITYIFGAIILIVYFILTRKYNFMKYLIKEVKSRPQEKISNIVMSVKSSFVVDSSKKVFLVSILVALVLPLIIFYKPRILYEKVDGGYAVRYYIYGVTNFDSATIPATYKGEKVVSLRGNTFSNMSFLEKVELPDTITEIRGQAFMNCKSLRRVNIPKNLEYLGGGAFYNATSIDEIELPDTLTYLGGEAFYGARSLTSIKLSNNLEEIHGDTFEYCTSLRSITIPDNVTRIGGHAFYGDTNLSEVNISENSKLTEIGSSAFRRCSSLYSIKIPSGTIVNERAFKESPTTVLR